MTYFLNMIGKKRDSLITINMELSSEKFNGKSLRFLKSVKILTISATKRINFQNIIADAVR